MSLWIPVCLSLSVYMCVILVKDWTAASQIQKRKFYHYIKPKISVPGTFKCLWSAVLLTEPRHMCWEVNVINVSLWSLWGKVLKLEQNLHFICSVWLWMEYFKWRVNRIINHLPSEFEFLVSHHRKEKLSHL